MQSVPVILYPAFIWACPSCMQWSVQTPIPADMTPDELREAIEQGGTNNRDDYVTTPQQVKCRTCGCEYEAIDHVLIEADDEDSSEQVKE